MAKKQIKTELLIIAGSAGSLNVIFDLLPQLRSDIKAAIVIVLHRKEDQESRLKDIFSFKTSIPILNIEDKDELKPGHIHIAPANYHLLFEHDRTLSLDCSEKIHFSRPSIDVAFESAAEVYGKKLISILLSGANADGAHGIEKVLAHGGVAVIQHPATAEVPFMPNEAIRLNPLAKVLDLEGIITLINQLNY